MCKQVRARLSYNFRFFDDVEQTLLVYLALCKPQLLSPDNLRQAETDAEPWLFPDETKVPEVEEILGRKLSPVNGAEIVDNATGRCKLPPAVNRSSEELSKVGRLLCEAGKFQLGLKVRAANHASSSIADLIPLHLCGRPPFVYAFLKVPVYGLLGWWCRHVKQCVEPPRIHKGPGIGHAEQPACLHVFNCACAFIGRGCWVYPHTPRPSRTRIRSQMRDLGLPCKHSIATCERGVGGLRGKCGPPAFVPPRGCDGRHGLCGERQPWYWAGGSSCFSCAC